MDKIAIAEAVTQAMMSEPFQKSLESMIEKALCRKIEELGEKGKNPTASN